MDEYGTPPWAGESAAWEEFARARGLSNEVKKFPWSFHPGGYVVKTGY